MDYDLSEYRKLYRSAKKGNIDSNSPVIAIQPESYTDIQNDFYLIPILSHEDIYLGGEQARMLQVATVPLVRPDSKPAKANIKATPAPITEDSYRSGIVFVIDTTLSMGPYIDRTREAVRRIYDEISRANLTDQVSFGWWLSVTVYAVCQILNIQIDFMQILVKEKMQSNFCI